jgi:uncharacterized membrane protein YgcG
MRAAVAGAAAALLFVAAPAAAERTLTIERFDAAIAVAADGSITVEETIVPRFRGTWNGIYRTIPVEYRTPQGLKYLLDLSVASVTDDFGYSLTYRSRRDGTYQRLEIPISGATDTTRTVKITYRVANALRFFDDHDELYWNVTGDGWDVPIESASASVLFPTGVTGLHATAFRGSYGSTAQTPVQVRDRSVSLFARSMAAREGVTAVIGWAPGLVRRPTGLDRTLGVVQANWPLGLPFVTFGLMFSLWWFRGRDPKPGSITTLYEPPADMTPAEIGLLLDGMVGMPEVTATIVDLAVRGYFRITASGPKSYAFSLTRPRKDWDALKEHERYVLLAMFDAKDSVSLEDVRQNVSPLADVTEALNANLFDRDFYARRPDATANGYVRTGSLMAVSPIIWIFASSWLDGAFGFPGLWTGVSLFVSGLVVAVFGLMMPTRSAAGTREYVKVLGFREFLSRVDADRLRRMAISPDTFEKYLPYAMVLGVEQKWAHAFDGMEWRRPDWYTGTADAPDFTPEVFARTLSSMSTSAGAAFAAAAARTTGGSGFGGESGSSGGFSGGGFGGGGGGGF